MAAAVSRLVWLQLCIVGGSSDVSSIFLLQSVVYAMQRLIRRKIEQLFFKQFGELKGWKYLLPHSDELHSPSFVTFQVYIEM